MSTDSCECMCTYSRENTCTDKYTHGSTSKDARGSMCTDACRSMCTDVSNFNTGFSTDSTGVHGSTCPYIYTKSTGMQVGTHMDIYMGNTVVRGNTCLYDKFGRCKTKQYIGMDAVGKV